MCVFVGGGRAGVCRTPRNWRDWGLPLAAASENPSNAAGQPAERPGAQATHRGERGGCVQVDRGPQLTLGGRTLPASLRRRLFQPPQGNRPQPGRPCRPASAAPAAPPLVCLDGVFGTPTSAGPCKLLSGSNLQSAAWCPSVFRRAGGLFVATGPVRQLGVLAVSLLSPSQHGTERVREFVRFSAGIRELRVTERVWRVWCRSVQGRWSRRSVAVRNSGTSSRSLLCLRRLCSFTCSAGPKSVCTPTGSSAKASSSLAACWLIRRLSSSGHDRSNATVRRKKFGQFRRKNQNSLSRRTSPTD